MPKSHPVQPKRAAGLYLEALVLAAVLEPEQARHGRVHAGDVAIGEHLPQGLLGGVPGGMQGGESVAPEAPRSRRRGCHVGA